MWLGSCFIFIPWMLIFNVVGNGMLQRSNEDNGSGCLYNGLFSMLCLLYLIFNYVLTIMYIFISCRIHSYMIRFFKRVAPNEPGVAIFRHRSCVDWMDGFDYAIFLLQKGRYNFHAERNYLASSLTKRHNAKLIDRIAFTTYSSDLEYNSDNN